MPAIFQGAVASLAFFIEGLTLVCMIGTVILWGVFGFLFVAEKQINARKSAATGGETVGKGPK